MLFIDVIDKEKFHIDYIYYEMKKNQLKIIKNKQSANIPSVSKLDVFNFIVNMTSYLEQKNR